MTEQATPDVETVSIPDRFVMQLAQGHWEDVCKFAERTGRVASLQRCLDRLQNIAVNIDGKVYLGTDFAPYSFLFSVEAPGSSGLNGGLIFHGSHDNGGDGSAPTYSVNLTPQDGWSIHT